MVLRFSPEQCALKNSIYFSGAAGKEAKMCQIEDCALCKAGKEFLKENLENRPLCQKDEMTSGQQLSHLSSLARKDGITPLIMAAAMNHDLCVDLLLFAGVDPNEESKVRCCFSANGSFNGLLQNKLIAYNK